MVNENTNQPRINNLQSLLQVAIQNQEPTSSNQPPIQPLDSERRAFLESAIREITVDHVEVLKKQIQKLKDLVEKLNSKNPLTEEESEDYKQVLYELTDNVSNIDFAIDFQKLNGLTYLNELINCNLVEYKIPAMDVFAEIVQNNEICQKIAYEMGFLKTLINSIKKEKDENVILKSIYALSCLLRGNDLILNSFIENENNINYLLNTMQIYNKNEKIIFKLSFLFNSIIGLKQDFIDVLKRLNFIFLSTRIMEENEQKSHEYILAIILAMCESSNELKNNLFRQNLSLKFILQKKLNFFNGKDEFLEETDYCKKLLSFIE